MSSRNIVKTQLKYTILTDSFHSVEQNIKNNQKLSKLKLEENENTDTLKCS